MPDAPKFIESLLKDVTSGFWEVSDEITAVPKKTAGNNNLFKYAEIFENKIRIPLYKSQNISEGVDLIFYENPELINGKYCNGSFTLNGYAIKDGIECSKEAKHQCRTGGKIGFEGAVYAIGNLINMIKEEKGYRAYFQVMAPILKSISNAEKETGIKDSFCRDKYYGLYSQDLDECIEYLLAHKLDDLQEWSGWYGLGATLVNVLNMELKPKEEEELIKKLSVKELLPYFNKILSSNEFTNNGQCGMKNILDKVRAPYLNDLPDSELEVIKILMEKYDITINDIIYDNNIKGLKLNKKGISDLPDNFGNLKKLQELNLSSNQFRALPKSIGELTKLQTLNLSYNKLETLPDHFEKLTKLQTLYLHNNKFSALSKEITQLTNLQTLYLNNNELKTLPDSITQLTNLQTLELGENQLISLPDSIGKLTALQTLFLIRNQLNALPKSIVKLTKLQELYLNANKLSDLPDNFEQLTNLQTLFLTNNQFRVLPDSIGQLTKLHILDLSSNELSALQKEVIKKLEEKGIHIGTRNAYL